MLVYLAGAGGLGLDYANGWRKQISNSVKTINPFRGGKLRKAYEANDYQASTIMTPNEIVVSDLLDIRRSDVVIAEMRSENYNYIGTSSEIFYAHSIGKPVILWTIPKYEKHPWLVHACVKIFTGELKEVIQYTMEKWWYDKDYD